MLEANKESDRQSREEGSTAFAKVKKTRARRPSRKTPQDKVPGPPQAGPLSGSSESREIRSPKEGSAKQAPELKKARIKTRDKDSGKKSSDPRVGGDRKKNMATTAALSKHRHPNTDFYPEVEYRVPKSREFTEAKIKLLNKVHPCELKDLHSFAHSNEHPLCAAMRSIGEAYALNCAISTLKDFKVDNKFILDVGGAGMRHHSMRRKYVWSCIPNHSAKDKLRKFVIPPGQHCDHAWSACDCHEFPISISVHSLYYIHPLEIFKRILAQEIPVHYALLHTYKGDSGSLMDGEMTYVRNGGDVIVRALGNIHQYVHPNMDWLDDGQMTFAEGTLVWERCRTFLDSEVIRFHAIPDVMKPRVIINTPAPKENLISKECFERMKFEEVINQCVLPHKEINPANRSKFLESVRRKGIANDLNIVRLIEYADKFYMRQEVMIQPVTERIQRTAYERLARLRMAVPRLDVRKLAAVALVVMIITIELSSLSGFSFPVTATLVAGVLACLMIAVEMLPRSVSHNLKPFDGSFSLSLFDKLIKWQVKAKVVDYCCKMPDKPSDPRKLIKLKEPQGFNEECAEKDAAYAMVYSPDHAPYFPRKCPHNVVSSIRNKLGQLIPDAGVYNLELHPVLEKIAKEANGSISPMDWEEWVSRFDSVKQKRLREEKERDNDEIIGSWNDTNFFTKFEAYAEPKYPRPICSTRVELNFGIGRWLIPLAEFLAEHLPEHLLFPIHGDSNEIGEFHSTYKGYHQMDCDFSSFDSSQTENALELVFTFLSLAGVPNHVLDRSRKDKDLVVVRTRKGLKVIMKGARFSGRSETLLGNTLITINTALHLFGDKLKAGMFKGDDTVLYLAEDLSTQAPLYVQSYLEQGLVAKLRSVDDWELEFCSSIFVPTVDSNVLTTKPGKLLAKTFWCKNLEYNHEEMERQFASILKGLARNLEQLPGLRGLYKNPVYLKWFNSVEAHYDLYNEYASQTVSYDQSALDFICERYDVTAGDIEDLEIELASSFPVRLSSIAAIKMIEKDWSHSNDSEHLREVFTPEPVTWYLWPCVEEILRHLLPITVTLFLGIVETILSGSAYHLIGHLVLLCLKSRYGFSVALIAHLLNNCFAGTRQLSLIMANRKPRVKRKNVRPKAKARGRKSQKMSPYVSMIGDPCNSSLVPGIFGDTYGLLGKYKNIVSPGEATTTGFLLWCPTGVNTTAATIRRMNFVYYSPAVAGTAPVNTGVNPFGNGTVTLGGVNISVGGNTFVTGNVCADFRTISACIGMTYKGTISSCAGRVAYINGLTSPTLLTGNAGNPMSVDQLFSYSSKVTRLSLDKMEVTYRPVPGMAHFFKNNFDSPLAHGAGAATQLSNDGNRFGDVWFGFAWDGVACNQLSFEFTQNVEWRPEADTGYVGNPGVVSDSTDVLKATLEDLDRYMPGWQTNVVSTFKSAASSIAQAALGGAGMYGAVEYRRRHLAIQN